MSSIDVQHAPAADGQQVDQDLGPLAWVLDELRKSLEGSVKAMRRFVRDAEAARESDLAALDAGSLRMARQQLHQACGALEMVGMGAPALVLRAMETAVQKFVQRPETCSDEAAAVIERASFALIEYLEAVLAGKGTSPVALFPQYRDAQALAGAERVHPADLWPAERRIREPEGNPQVPALPYGPEARSQLDAAVLRIVKSGDLNAALSLRDTCLGFVVAQQDRQPRAFWKICAGFFEAFGCNLLHVDVYVKRVASRVLMQYATLAKGDASIGDRLVQDLLFFCSQAKPSDAAAPQLPALMAVRQAFALDRFRPVDYETARFGRFDPAVLAQARKRIAAATETWSTLAGGDRNKLKPAADQFTLVCDSLRKLQPESESLAQSLTHAIEVVTRSGEPPSPALAMEVATSVLYLQAAFEDVDPSNSHVEQRAQRLAQRLDSVVAGAEPEPLEQWMEELYRRVSDSQTMGSVVDELRATLLEVEKSLDQYFRNPAETAVLSQVPSNMAQMRGVLSVLGLDQASLAVVRMRELVDRLLINDVPEDERPPLFEKLGNSLGALGFLIDMLSYQRTMARKLFVYDEELGELRIVMGKARARGTDPESDTASKTEVRAEVPLPTVVPRTPVVAPVSAPTDFGSLPQFFDIPLDTASAAAPLLPPVGEISFEAKPQLFEAAAASEPVAVPVVAAPEVAAAPQVAPAVALPVVAVRATLDVEDELLEVFLEEAREVVTNGTAAIEALQAEPGDLSEQTTLRRAFHTLKGSSRMVGLNDFGEAAWSMEQLLNTWLAEQKPIKEPLLQLSQQALQAFDEWSQDIAAGRPSSWEPAQFAKSALAMRDDGVLLPLAAGGAAEAAPELSLHEAATLAPDVADTSTVATSESLQTEAAVPEVPELNFPDWNAPAPAPAPAQSTDAEDAALQVPEIAPVLAEEIDFEQFNAVLQEQGEPAVEPHAAKAVANEFALDFDVPGFGAPQTASSDIDFASALLGAEPAYVPGADSAQSVAAADAPAVAEPAAVEPEPAEVEEDPVKVIDSLRISLPLYNVYLNEADDWSRKLMGSLQDWSQELHEPLPDTAVAYAHSLAGSSSTVGFAALSDLSRVLEHALQHVQLQSQGKIEQARVFMAAADDIRRLLHQFAAGFLKEPQREVLNQLREILETEVVSSLAPLDDAAMDDMLAKWDAEEERRRAPEADVSGDDLAQDTVVQALQPVSDEVQWEPLEAEETEVLPEVSATDLSSEPVVEPLVEALDEMHAELGTDLVPVTVEAQAPALPAVEVPLQEVAPALSSYASTSTDADVDLDSEIDKAIALAMAMDADDDIDAIDMIDPDLFPIFEEEAAELMPQLGGALRQWTAQPDNLKARGEVLRALHTLKGSARLAGAMRLGEMAHRLESAIEGLDLDTVVSAEIEPLQSNFDGLQANFAALRAIGQSHVDSIVALPTATLPVTKDDEPEVQERAPVPAAPAAPAVRLPGPASLAMPRMAANQTVRVRAQLLDRLVNQAGEVMISRSRLEERMEQFRGSLNDLSGNLDRLRQQLRDIEVQAESQMQSRLALSKDSAAGFDPLEFDRFTRVQELTRMMAESVNDVATVQRNLQRATEGAEDDLIAQGRQARELQRDLLRTRMVEFESIAERLYTGVRLSSKETGKQVKLDIVGGSIDMDRGVLDRMIPAFEHLLRNCVAHGIEDPQVRLDAGKPAVGTITVELHHEGNDVSVEFRDDGAGLNLERIREQAISKGLIAPHDTVDVAHAGELIFTPGFSTAATVTGLSGRGIGMDVVRSEVQALGGRIETTSQPGNGSAFKLVLPLTTAVTQVVMLRAGELAFGVPANLVEIVRRTPATEVEAAYASGSYHDGKESIPFFWSGALLQASAATQEPVAKTRPVVVFRSASQRLAMHVDEVLGNQEVVVKNLGPQLSRLPGLSGMSVLASGAVVLIYNPVALATVYGDQVRMALEAGAAQADATPGAEVDGHAPVSPLQLAPAAQVPLVLVVDDSITVRRVTQRLLQREGYRVALAADGLQALERLQDERPTVVLSDIEMPRMDGFDLARNIRADASMQDLPIIMITSRIAEKHREHAMALGVNHYLGKPYSDEELLSLIQHYARIAQPSQAE